MCYKRGFRRKRFLFFLFVFLVLNIIKIFFLDIENSFSASSLQFSLVLNKNEFTPQEPINVNFKLENIGKDSLYVNKRFYVSAEDISKEKREIYLMVVSPSGEKLPCKFRYEAGLPKTDYFVLLKPGEEAVSEWERDLRNFFDFSKAGEYKITAVYENSYGSEIGLDVFKEKLTSETVSIRIKE